MAYPSPSSLRARLHSPVSAITAYDYPSARLCDEAGIQMILVGDSLGMVVAGHPDTTSVTLDHMVYHTEMVRRGVKRAVIVADLPIHSYETTEAAVASGHRLMEAGGDAVKLEGGLGQIKKVEALTEAGIAVCGHIGMLPQRVLEEGGYRKKGKLKEEAERLVMAAKSLEEAGAFALVLESMVAEVATRITEATGIPTIGIGAGEDCDGQIRVLHDVIGGYPWFVPPFAKVYGNTAEVTREAVSAYVEDVQRQNSAH
ncbi:MAG: 3-methyl-2-oxobutanoate hydroxymethyltransferase [Verrucomicrobiales bacterium]|nr:3-methyl-2-oxobutanoate hydroxymethyltransferase [Verrucomicrobiales bacterium]